MTAFQDFEDKNVDKAVERASKNLGISRDDLKFDIISHGSSGIFGLVGAKKAVIRVYLPGQPASQSDSSVRQNEPASPTEDENESVAALLEETFGPEPNNSDPLEDTTSGNSAKNDTEMAAVAKPAPDQGAVSDWVKGFLDQIVALISPDSRIEIEQEDKLIRFQILGGDSARLIGKHGQTLDAIYYLIEKGVYKQFGPALAIEIDVEGYLEKRRSELTALASKLAQKAQKTGKPMVINRINAQERRVIHLCLRENRQVRTQSVGNGDLRKLLIMPKKKNQAKRQSSKTQ
jgi:spoIIIJ-associated protein